MLTWLITYIKYYINSQFLSFKKKLMEVIIEYKELKWFF